MQNKLTATGSSLVLTPKTVLVNTSKYFWEYTSKLVDTRLMERIREYIWDMEDFPVAYDVFHEYSKSQDSRQTDRDL